MSSSGGSITIQWTASQSAVVNITGGAVNSFTVNGTPVTFPYTLSTTTEFDTIYDGSYSVSVQLNGFEIASTPDGVRLVQLTSGNGLNFAPSVDDEPNNNFASSLSATFAAAKIANPVRLDVPSFLGSGQTRYNGTSYSHPVTSEGNDIYCVAYIGSGGSDNGDLIVAKRTLPNGAWTTYDLKNVAANPLALPVDTDSHNTASIIIDAAGYLHVWANMHGDVMRYVKSTNPRDISAWASASMTGTNEGQATYPRPALHPDGDLFLLFRDGASGNGDLYLNRRTTAGAWSQVKLADGKSNNENPYETPLVIGRDGSLNVGFTWRPNGGDWTTNDDVHFLRSTDKGATWKAVDGTSVSLPLVHSNTSARALLTTGGAPTNSGIINQFGLDVDTSGRPHMALSQNDGTDINVYHLWWNGSAWVNDKVTNLANGTGYDNLPTRPVVVTTNLGRTLIGYSCPRSSTLSGSFRFIDVTPAGAASGTPLEFPFANIDGRDHELNVDWRSLRDQGLFRTLLSCSNAEVSSPGLEYNNIDNWSRQLLGVVTVDLSLLSELAQGKPTLPTIKTIASIGSPNYTVPNTQTSLASLAANIAPYVTGREARNQRLFVSLAMRASVGTSGGTLNVQIREFQQVTNTTRNFGKLAFTGTSTAILATPWMPLSIIPTYGFDMFIDLLAQMTGTTSTGPISSLAMKVGVLDGPIFY